MTDRHYWSIRELAEQIRTKTLSPVEIVEACLKRIDRLNPELNAFITVLSDRAIEDARHAESEIRTGKWRGPLHGVPVGIKDFYDTAGVRTTAAFEHFQNRIPKRDAVGVAKLKEAGAIVVGKTNMHTLGMGTTGLKSHFGPVKNPWNADYIPAGSSSGSAAAVASGLCYATLDTDAIGSCRLPAACCGVVGFKGTYGLIDMTGILEGEQPPDETILWLSHAGITARRVDDAALVLDVLAERNGQEGTRSYSDAITIERSLRIGVATNARADDEVAAAFERAVDAIRGLGHATSQAAVPFGDPRQGIGNIQADRASIAGRAFKDIDLLVLPTIPTTTPSVKAVGKNEQALSPENTAFANYYGLPAVSIPCGFDSRGLPVGLQIVGRPGDDAAVLRLAHEFPLTESRRPRT